MSANRQTRPAPGGAGATLSLAATVLLMLAPLAGCSTVTVGAAVNSTIGDTNTIVQAGNLTAQEKRDLLTELGYTQVEINGLLRTDRIGNQFGGDLTSAYEKAAAGQLSTLTPDEVQIYADGASAADPDVGTSFDDNEARLIVDLFNEYDLNTGEELGEFFDDSPELVPEGLDAEDLRTVFVDFDPDDLRDELP
jgi:hypothetical protein